MALESLILVVGVDHSRRLKLCRRRRHCSSPPRLFSGQAELQNHLGFVKGEEASLTQLESHQVVVGIAATTPVFFLKPIATEIEAEG